MQSIATEEMVGGGSSSAQRVMLGAELVNIFAGDVKLLFSSRGYISSVCLAAMDLC